MSVMQAIQEKFQQFYIEQRRPVASLAVSDVDYEALVIEMMPPDLDLSKYRKPYLTRILDYTDGNMVDILHNPTIEQGTFVLNG